MNRWFNLAQQSRFNLAQRYSLAFAIADKGHKDEIFKQGMLSLGYEQVDKRSVSKEYFEAGSANGKANAADLKLAHDLIGHWISEQLTGTDAKAKQIELTFLPNNQLIFKTQWLKEQAVNTDSFEGSYFVRDAKLMVRSPGDKAEPWDCRLEGNALVIKAAGMDATARLKRVP